MSFSQKKSSAGAAAIPTSTLRKTRRFRWAIAVAVGAALVASTVGAADFHVSPDGNPWAKGSREEPLDLATALAGDEVRPGDTVWIHGGTYEGSFIGRLSGTEDQPIEVRAYRDESPRIDGVGSDEATLLLQGQWTVYRDLEVTNSEYNRWGKRAPGLDVTGKNLVVANMVLHDLGNIGFWSPAENLVVYGCLIYNNGYDDSDRGHGHGAYSQNSSGTKSFVDNVFFGGYAWGFHIYGEGGHIEGYDIIGNTWFDAGVNSTISGYKDNCLVGGYQPASRILLKENNGWARQPTLNSVRLGWAVPNRDVTLLDNYLVGNLVFQQTWTSITMTGNTTYGVVSGINPNRFPDNEILVNRPRGERIVVRPNLYEAGRALVTVYNWEAKDSVEVDLSNVMEIGARYEFRDAQNYFGAPVAEGVFSGEPVVIPMGQVETAPLVGSPMRSQGHTPSEFGVFVVRSDPRPSARCHDKRPDSSSE